MPRRRANLGTLALVGTAAIVLALPYAIAAQTVGDTFRKVSPAVVVIRATGHDVSGSGEVRFSEIGSGVLISRDGKVMTAAHVVHAMELDRVPDGILVASMANSDHVRIGDQALVIGAPIHMHLVRWRARAVEFRDRVHFGYLRVAGNRRGGHACHKTLSISVTAAGAWRTSSFGARTSGCSRA